MSHRGHFGSALMSAEELDVPALGYVVENHQLGRALLARSGTTGGTPALLSGLCFPEAGAEKPAVLTDEGASDSPQIWCCLRAGVATEWFEWD